MNRQSNSVDLRRVGLAAGVAPSAPDLGADSSLAIEVVSR